MESRRSKFLDGAVGSKLPRKDDQFNPANVAHVECLHSTSQDEDEASTSSLRRIGPQSTSTIDTQVNQDVVCLHNICRDEDCSRKDHNGLEAETQLSQNVNSLCGLGGACPHKMCWGGLSDSNLRRTRP